MRKLVLSLLIASGIACPDVKAADKSVAAKTEKECVAGGGTWTSPAARQDYAYCYPENTASCSAKGGTLRVVCMSGSLMCVIRAPDAGKACSDSSECSIACLAGDDRPANKDLPVRGRCQEDNDPCGCRVFVKNGKIDPGGCTD